MSAEHAARPTWREPLLEMCLLFVRTDVDGEPHLLLGEKLRGFGRGRFVAPGGKIDPGETPPEAAVRELFEETGVGVATTDLDYAGHVTFVFPYRHDRDQRAHIFFASRWSGAPADSDEIAVRWTPVARIPYECMWADARHWLPAALRGDLGAPVFWYADDNTSLTGWEGLPGSPGAD